MDGNYHPEIEQTGSTGWSSGVVLGRKVTTRRFWYKGY